MFFSKDPIEIRTNFQPLTKCRQLGCNADLISKLSDDILINVISFLSPNESARTSVLSSRWKNLWKHSHCLDFDAYSTLAELIPNDELYVLLPFKRRSYIEWVNSVIQSHKSLNLKLFKIRFSFNKYFKREITRWIQFAFSRQVERFELDLLHYDCFTEHFCFPDPKTQPILNLTNYKSLKTLSFKSLDVADGAIEYFIHNCPQLEQVIVVNSKINSELEVCRPSLVLKHLDLSYCQHFKSIKVTAPRLTSLIVPVTEGLLLKNVPELVDVSVTFVCLKSLILSLSCCFSQLEVLCLSLSGIEIRKQLLEIEEKSEPCYLPEMPKLKKFFIQYEPIGSESLVGLAALIKAAPHLEEFVFKYDWWELPRIDRQLKDHPIRFPHHRLKVFKFICDCKRTSYLFTELCGTVLKNCVALEKIVFDPSGEKIAVNKEQPNERMRNAKKLFVPLVPHHIELGQKSKPIRNRQS